MESEATKQQRRIEQLLSLSEGVKTSSTAQNVRKEIEKSILVRQLKQQLAHLRNLVADKDAELETMKREIRFTHVKEVEVERDEYYAEIQRLLRVVEELKEELLRERQRREWNNKLAGETGDDLRRELARLANGYQNILANISNPPKLGTNSSGMRPSTAVDRSHKVADNEHKQRVSTSQHQRPRSAGSKKPEPSQAPPNLKVITSQKLTDNDSEGAIENHDNIEGWEALDTPHDGLLERPSIEAGFNASDYEQGDNNSSNKAIEPKTTFQPLATFAPVVQQQQLPLFLQQPPPVIKTSTTASLQPTTHTMRVGDRVKAKFRGGETYYDGKIAGLLPDGTYHIIYDDSDEERGVTEDRIVCLEERAPSATSSITSAGTTPSQQGAIKRFDNVYKLGDKVEALYYGGSTWYKGEVKGFAYNDAKKSFVYEVAYEDGEREKQVLETNIRLQGVENIPIVQPEEPLKPQIDVTSPIDALTDRQVSGETIPTVDETTASDESKNYPKKAPSTNSSPRPVSAAIKSSPMSSPLPSARRENPDRSDTEVKLAENEAPSATIASSSGMPKMNASPIVAEFKVNDRIEALYDKGTMWFAGKITEVVNQGETFVYNISYDDGDQETGVGSAFIRLKQQVAPSTDPPAKFKVNDKVEGYFEQYGAWFPGHIRAVNANGTFHVIYDDGDEEKAAEEVRLRKKALTVRKEKYSIGDRIEARYGGDAAWFPGKISKINSGGGAKGLSYNIVYDDGDTEENVVGELIRVLDPNAVTPVMSASPSLTNLAPVPLVANNALPAAVSTVSNPTNTSASSVPIITNASRENSATKSVKIASTNLDDFLGALSDDDEGAPGALDGGRPVANLSNSLAANVANDEDAYEDEFDA